MTSYSYMKFWLKVSFQGLLLLGVLMPVGAAAAEARIFVVKERDGTIRFTNREPAKGVKSEVFTAKRSGFSTYSIRSSWSPRLFPNRFEGEIEQAARLHGVDPNLVRAVIHAESAFNPRALSPKGAQGLMQLMPAKARELGVRAPFKPQPNIIGGTKHLSYLLKKYKGNTQLALAAYNAGEGAVERYDGIPPYTETQNYVRRVLSLKRKYSASGHGQRGATNS